MIVGLIGLWLALLSSLCFACQPCTNRILLGQDIIRIVLAEQSSKPKIEGYEDYYSITAGILYVVGMTCWFLACALVFIRKHILIAYGCPTGLAGYINPFCDHRVLREIAQTQVTKERRILFTWINILIPVLSISGIFIMFFAYSF